jgi:transposase
MIDILGSLSQFYIRCGYTDLRKQIDGLVAIVQSQVEMEEGALFLFCGKRADRMKGLFWDGTGYVLIYKRLTNSRFQWPRNEEDLKRITQQEYRWLMEGLSIYQKKAIRSMEQRPVF